MLSASAGRDSCQRISADSSNANSVNFRNKPDSAAIMLSMQHGRRHLEPGPVKEIAQGVGGEPHSEFLAQTAGKPHQPVFAPSRDQPEGLRQVWLGGEAWIRMMRV